MKRILQTVVLVNCALIIACGGLGAGGPGTLTLKYPGTEKQEMPVKSGGFYVSTKTWSGKGKMSTSSSHFICVADHEIDRSQGSISINKNVTDGQTKVCFDIDGEETTTDKTLLKTGTYQIGKTGENFAFSSIDSAGIRAFKDGKQIKHDLKNHKTSGEIKINSASSETINGDINLTDGEIEIKGKFSAQVHKS